MDKTMLTIYIKDNCPQCHATMRWLRERDIPFDSINISDPSNAKQLAWLRARGIKQTPYVVAAGESWSGFRPDKLSKLLE
ncbi:glutaredoxin domain-containing protein [Oenococcus kitaharae]|nr:glutaredoxin domain-containing protein [Oenococcus kitaharae]